MPDAHPVPPVDAARLASTVPTTADRQQRTVRAPATDEKLGTVPDCRPADVDAAVERARTAQQAWADRTIADRVAVLRDVHDAVLDRQQELVDTLQAETGKARGDAAEEVLDIANNARYYADTAEQCLSPSSRSGVVPGVTRAVEHCHPKGVVGIVTPWNYPLTLAVSDALPALVAGNAVVVKPAEGTPYSTILAAEILRESGVPEDCFQVVTGEGTALGEPLIEAVDMLTFTGSTATGRTVAELAGRHLTETSLELGGKNPAVVLDDADIERTATGIVRDSFANAGQLCVSIERVYVAESVYHDVRDAVVERTDDLTVGVGRDWALDVGSLQSATQLAKVSEHVEDARERGATVLAGGEHRPDIGPYVYEPTVLADVPEDARLVDEETFGPVVRLEPVADAGAAVAAANDSAYGLHGAVWTGDTDRGADLAARIDCGTVAVNDTYRAMWSSMDAPMGGRGDSGIGRRHGRQGIEKYTDAQSVVSQRGPALRPEWLPDKYWIGAVTGYSRLRNTASQWLPR